MARSRHGMWSLLVSSTLVGPLAAQTPASLAWMTPALVKEQRTARSDEAREAVARERAHALVRAMTLPQKMQQLTGSKPSVLPELPSCFGARHVDGIAALAIPTFRITNGPVGVGQNDCVSLAVRDAMTTERRSMYRAYSDPSSAKATALPSAMAVAASFDPRVAADFGAVIAREMNDLALHVFEAPGMNLARLPILGRNFEYFGEDPYLAGTMAVAEIRAVQAANIIAMAKHFVANEQETNRMTIQESVDEQVLRELYLIPFEMSVRDAKVAAVMCSYNFLNGLQACANKPMLTGVLRDDWGFTGYVQTDFFAQKSTAAALDAGLDHEMPTPIHWAPDKLTAALAENAIAPAQIDRALERRYTQMFRAGIFDRALRQTPIDYAAGARAARAIGARAAVLLQNNGALPLARAARTIALVGKASQPYAQQAIAGGAILGKPMGAGGGSSDVVPAYTVTPLEGLRAGLRDIGRADATVSYILVDDGNRNATVDGRAVTFEQALVRITAAEAVVVMAGTNAEEGADRASFTRKDGHELAQPASAGLSLDWYVAKPSAIATADGETANPAHSSETVAMLTAILSARSTTAAAMPAKTVLVLKDNASVALDPALLGPHGPSILEVWFPGQEDGHIVADVLLGRAEPNGRLPVTFPIKGRSFLDSIAPSQFPGIPAGDGSTQTVTYSEGLEIGYRWYDSHCGSTPCVAFPFGHGLSYTRLVTSEARLEPVGEDKVLRASVAVRNTGSREGTEVVQAYLSLPPGADVGGARQPPRRLVAFERVTLAPGESRRVTIAIDPAASHHPMSVWNKAQHAWVTPHGRYVLRLGTSSALRDLIEAGSVTR
ncbi:glycoside hydrolase family 3 C-terminal domain-containing protein [Sphingomonas yunnanensis]|uniref:beta-glucosidase family protein n=1 Tax=Sphingomonas yunnanensis TaxID=310400 RepID=UPI001CA7782B|nr:glycoside hydrolase family 3 N-terminal domain-containing protein [Sphingomonas yunnanensis]MBY9063673.1 glycoside hydrolase family 3 C-terminal domain-containing protein [Sphingomonas yunnanensis]